MAGTAKRKYAAALGCMVSLSALVMPLGPALAVSPTIGIGQSLEFGNVIAGISSGTVQIRVNGTRSTTGGVTAAGGTVLAGEVQVSGDGSPVVLTISAPSFSLTGPGANMVVNNFEIETSAGGLTQTVTPAATTTLAVPIGATLNVNASQVGGSYTGNFTINAVYQ